MTMLPVDAVTAELHTALQRHRNAVLQAPPGAGKTTRIPLVLLEASWLQGQRIVMLEPRRLAARAAARYMARQLGEDVGGTVGYRVRLDTRVSARTRIEVVTEGVLTRMLQSDPALDGVGLVIFDEFHERSLHADLGLALTLQARSLFRPELAILVMSATLQSERVAALLGNAPIITSEGRTYPVEIEQVGGAGNEWIENAVAGRVQDVLAAHDGDVLVFLPGRAEIQRTHTKLAEAGLPPNTDIYPLFGDLSPELQDRAITPSPPGRRKIVLATAIAETSLTIEGVRVVIDSGLMRVPRFSARTGMTRLETVRVTRASAHQRTGRAGRTAPGICYRLWSHAEHSALLEHGEPEIMQADLAPLALDLAAWGVSDPGELRWLDAPPAAAYAQASELLRELAAIDEAGALTTHGQRMSTLPLHPRLAHMVLHGAKLGQGALAADLAALLGERDVLRDTADPDLGLRLLALQGRRTANAHQATLQRVQAEANEIRRTIGHKGRPSSFAEAGLLLAFAYPDRIARRRPGTRGRFLLRHGRGATLDPASALAASEFIVAAQVDDRGAETRVFLAAELSEQDLETHFADQFETTRELEWDRENTRDGFVVRARERVQLGALIMRERVVAVTPEERVQAVFSVIRGEGLTALPWSDAARELRLRLAFLHNVDPAWPDVSDEALLGRLDEWLAPALAASEHVDLYHALEHLLDWSQRSRLTEWAPTHLTVPTGSRIPLDYSDPAAPVLAVRLQEVFGWLDTPRIAAGRVPVVMHLLSPAQRPVQVTRDLANFWRTTYFEVRKDLKGRYPKHYWPDDPLSARPTRRTRPGGA